MVFVGQGRSEEGHDPVAHDLVDGALVAVDSFHRVFEDRIKKLARLLGIPVGEQLHRTFQVGEEDGDLLAFALQSALGSQDSFGQVLRRVAVGRAR
jgi:hypothetical protein